MSSRTLLTLAPAVLALAACGGATHTSSHAASATPPATTATTTAPSSNATSTTTTTPPPASSTISSEPAKPSRCLAGELALSFLGGQGATGHGELGFALRNTGTRMCIAFGYPGVEFLDRAGGALATVPTHTTQDFFGSVTDHPLALGPGDQVSFRLGVTHGAASTAGCTTAYGLQVIPPNDTATLRATIPNGTYECATTTVTPLQPGTSAFA